MVYGSAPSDWKRGVFACLNPVTPRGKVVLSHEQFALLLGGIDLGQARRRRWYRKPVAEEPHKSRSTSEILHKALVDPQLLRVFDRHRECDSPATTKSTRRRNFFPRPISEELRTTETLLTAISSAISEDRHRVSKPAAVRGVEYLRAGRAAASTADCEVRAGQRKALRRATGVAGAGAGGQVCSEAESQRESPASSRKPKRKHPGRQALPTDLPRVEKIVACTPEQCRCGGCGGETTVIGYEESEQLGAIRRNTSCW